MSSREFHTKIELHKENGNCNYQQCQNKHIGLQYRKTHSIFYRTWVDKSNQSATNCKNYNCSAAKKYSCRKFTEKNSLGISARPFISPPPPF